MSAFKAEKQAFIDAVKVEAKSQWRYLKFVVRVVVSLLLLDLVGVLANQPDTTLNILSVVVIGALGVYWVRRFLRWRRYLRVRDYLRQRGMLPMVLLLAVAVSSAHCATRVNAGTVGIKINYAGTYRGVQDLPVVTGWVFYWPGSSTVLEYPIYVQNVVWTHNVAEGNPQNEEITFTNADQMSIAVDVSLAYHLDSAKVPGFYMKFRNDDLQGFTLGFMRNVARDQFNAHGGSYHMEQIMGDNAKFIKDVRDSLQQELEPYGVVLDQFGIIGSPRPPDSVLHAITAKVQAQQIAIQKENELAQSKADANKVVAQAEGYARALQLKADAEAAYNKKVSESLTPLLVQHQTVDRWNGILPTMTGGAIPLLQLPNIK